MRRLPSIFLAALLASIAGDVRADDDVFACATIRPFVGEHCALPTTHLKPASFPAAMPGAPPDARHRLGTVFFGWNLEGLGATVTEWDIATRRALRQTSLGLNGADVHGTRAGDELHMVVGSTDAYWVVVDVHRLRIRRKIRLAHWGPQGIATDGSRTLISFRDASPQPQAIPNKDRCLVSAFDRDGRELGSWRPEDPVPDSGPDLAVLEGRAYSTTYGGDRRGIVELSPEATPIRHVELSTAPADSELTVHDGRLFVTLGKEFIELSPDLQVLERRTARNDLGLVVGGPNGQRLVGCREILSPSLRMRAEIHSLDWCSASFWVGNVPVVVSMRMEPGVSVLINWIDPAFLTGEPAEGVRTVPPSPRVVPPEP
ncbi:MAG: hypothetical protein M3O36_11120 [Myxococcota bacterium]|nr:hypothetical protein [Myxococcota bacterium]